MTSNVANCKDIETKEPRRWEEWRFDATCLISSTYRFGVVGVGGQCTW